MDSLCKIPLNFRRACVIMSLVDENGHFVVHQNKKTQIINNMGAQSDFFRTTRAVLCKPSDYLGGSDTDKNYGRSAKEQCVKIMEKKKLDRLSELTAISRKRELTEDEKSERELLRNEYRAGVVANLTAQLDNTVIVRPDGTTVQVKDMKRSREEK